MTMGSTSYINQIGHSTVILTIIIYALLHIDVVKSVSEICQGTQTKIPSVPMRFFIIAANRVWMSLMLKIFLGCPDSKYPLLLKVTERGRVSGIDI